MRITIDAALREQHGERDDDCEMDQRHEEERGLHRGAKLLPTGTRWYTVAKRYRLSLVRMPLVCLH